MSCFAKFLSVLIASSIVVVTVREARAQDLGTVVGTALGVIIGGAADRQRQQQQRAQPQRQRTAARPANPGVSAAQRTQNAEVQAALNYFGYNVGAVDGLIGPRSRAAISDYQAAMGFGATGRLENHQRQFLTSSHQRALSGASNPRYQQVLAQQGPRGLLRSFRDEQLGLNTAGAQQGAAAPAPQREPAKKQTTPVIPTFPNAGITTSARSVNQHCNEVQILTTTNGGYITVGAVTNPAFAMNEQFCLARAYATSSSNGIISSISGLTFDQVKQQCDGLAQVMAPSIEGLGERNVEDVKANISTVLASSGQTQEQLTTGGQICLGVGYRVDDPAVSLASALMLVSAGHDAYGEIVGHHLREGFGTKASTEGGRVWLGYALDAIDSGADPAFLPAESHVRVSVLRAALNDGGSAPKISANSDGAPSLPSFGVPSGN